MLRESKQADIHGVPFFEVRFLLQKLFARDKTHRFILESRFEYLGQKGKFHFLEEWA